METQSTFLISISYSHDGRSTNTSRLNGEVMMEYLQNKLIRNKEAGTEYWLGTKNEVVRDVNNILELITHVNRFQSSTSSENYDDGDDEAYTSSYPNEFKDWS